MARTKGGCMKIKPVQIKKILYTTDFSDTSLYAYSYAVSLANLYRASITVLHVITDPINIEAQLSGLLPEDQWAAIKNRHIEEARETLLEKRRDNVIIHETLNQFTENVKAENRTSKAAANDEVVVLWGEPVDKILKVSEEGGCDLIIMGTHGHGLLDSLLGTTAKKVLRKSMIPVLTVRLPD